MPINILVIDDDKRIVQRLMKNLKRADATGKLGCIEVDDSIIKLDSIEKYDVSHFGINFNVALIDYQLTCSFTGILVSAWISLYLKIPRLTLTTASYPGNPNYFDGSILKNEITDSPQDVIQRIIECVNDYEADVWLNNQHQLLVSHYQKLLAENSSKNNPEFIEIQNLLDKFEKVLDAQQETELKKVFIYEENTNKFILKEKENEKKLEELSSKLSHYLEVLKND